MRSPALALLLTAALTGCASGGGQKVVEPEASIQQLAVAKDGSWSLQLRLQNYSAVAMRFEQVALTLSIAGQPAGTLNASAATDVPASSAEVVTLPVQPTLAGRNAVSDALASGHAIDYTLSGQVTARPEGAKPRAFAVDTRSGALNAVPGLPGVLR